MPSVSVVTTTYNRAHLIGETIRSVLDQTFRDFEYIIVDDGSEDGTEGVVRGFDDPRISFLRLPHSGRLSTLRNFSHTKCRGEFIAYVDSDDLWDTTKLEKQIAGLRANPAAGFSFTDVQVFNTRGIIRETLYGRSGVYTGNVFDAMLRNELVICHTTLVVRRTSMDQVGQSDESFTAGDHDFVFRLGRNFDAVILYEPLVHVRKHDQNTTHNHAYSLMGFEEHQRTLKKFLDSGAIASKTYRAAVRMSSYSFGVQSAAAGDYHSAMKFFNKSLLLGPWRAKTWLKIAQTLAKKVLAV